MDSLPNLHSPAPPLWLWPQRMRGRRKPPFRKLLPRPRSPSHVSIHYSIIFAVSDHFSGNVSPYSTGAPGASLTSTSVDPQTQSSKLLWDEEELMFEDISNPPKGKGKEKDVGKRRAYVRVITSLGGSLNLELYCEKVRWTMLVCAPLTRCQ